jgi:hypothetical protein
MRREDLIAFARRDWQLLAAMKERFWIEQKQPGYGDYMRERQDIFADLTIETLLNAVNERAQTK